MIALHISHVTVRRLFGEGPALQRRQPRYHFGELAFPQLPLAGVAAGYSSCSHPLSSAVLNCLYYSIAFSACQQFANDFGKNGGFNSLLPANILFIGDSASCFGKMQGQGTVFTAPCRKESGLFFQIGVGLFLHDVVRAALNNARCGDKGQLRFLLQLGDGERAAVAHGGFDFAQRERDIVL